MKRIGKYIVHGLFGRGGMGAVYQVELPGIEKILALKLLAPQPALIALLGKPEIRRRFLAEARTMGRIRHPHITAICDFEDSDQAVFFTMEYYCQNLGDLIGERYDLEDETRRIRVDRAAEYVRQTLSGLTRLHQEGIVHRDIKPFNLLITNEDRVKITDFGLSKLRGEVHRGPRHLHVGTPYYTAPEQEKDPNRAGPAADLFSAGVLLYRLLTGRLPQPGIPPSRLHPDLDSEWDAFLFRSMHQDPERRFSHASEMAAELDRLGRQWADRQKRFCLESPEVSSPSATAAVRVVRHLPQKVAPKDASRFFQLDRLGRPRNHSENHFVSGPEGLVLAQPSGLIWSRAGSDFPMTWDQAGAHVAELNRLAWSGFRDWRLPTVDELVTLLRKPSDLRDHCLDPVFNPDQRILWSMDRRSATAAWYVHTELGFVGWQDRTCLFHVRAVRSGGGRIRNWNVLRNQKT